MQREWTKRTAADRLQQQEIRTFNELAQLGEVLRADGAIDDAVIRAQPDGHALADDDLVLRVDDRFFHDRADGDDEGLRRVNDRGEALDAVAAEVRDGDRAAGVFVGLELLGAGTAGEVLDRFADLAERFLLRVADDRRDEAFLDGDGNAEIDAAVLDDRVTGEAGIHGRDFRGGGDDGLEDKIVDSELRSAGGFARSVGFRAELHERAGVGFDVEIEMRDGGLAREQAL